MTRFISFLWISGTTISKNLYKLNSYFELIFTNIVIFRKNLNYEQKKCIKWKKIK